MLTCPSNRPAWAVLLLLLAACESKSSPAAPSIPTITSRKDLPEERANVVLAKVGDRTITLGDYVSALERMDGFERLRYQTKERRKLLLDEMIEVELLAREAERLGLDREPETRALLDQLMREEVLRDLRDAAPRPEEVPQAEVAAYYAAHPEEFADPERRRVAVIALADQGRAEETLELVRDGDEKHWGEVARERSVLTATKRSENSRPLEFEGDLGLTSAPGQARGRNPAIPDAVAAAAFKLDEPGVLSEIVPSGNRFYVVRLLAKSPARRRSLEEADTVIRVRLVQQKVDEAEAALQAELEKKYPVKIDEAALAGLEIPKAGPGRTNAVPDSVATSSPP